MCGFCYLRLRKGHDLSPMAAVRGAHSATPHVSRKRPTPGDAAEPEAGGAPELDASGEGESGTFKCFAPGVTRVYGEGGLFPTIPAGVQMLIYGARETLNRLTEKGVARRIYRYRSSTREKLSGKREAAAEGESRRSMRRKFSVFLQEQWGACCRSADGEIEKRRTI